MSNIMKDVLVSDQWLESIDPQGLEVSMALSHVQSSSIGATNEVPGVTLQERPLTGLLSLRGDANDASLGATLKRVCNLSLPGSLKSDTSEQTTIRWMTPDEWLISADVQTLFAIEQELRQGVSGSIAVVNVTGGYSVLHLGGMRAVDVLKKSTPYDVHPINFPEAKVVNTTFAKSQATLRAMRTGYEIIVRRSFADYVWIWIHVAAEEYGLDVTP